MSHVRWGVGVLVASLVLLPSVGFSEEQTSQANAGSQSAAPDASSSAPTPEAPAAPEAPVAAPAPEVPAAPEPAPVAPPVLKPITITFSGDLSAVSTTDNPPMITVQDRYGVKKEISVPGEAKVTAGSAAKTVSDLKVGDKLTVEYSYDVATGKRTAISISIGEGAK